MAETLDHYHLTASKALKNGTTDRHRFTVATEHVESEQRIAHEMGYSVTTEICHEHCLLQPSAQ